MKPDTLVLCRGTIAGASFRERVEAASGAGFGGISLFAADYDAARAEGFSDADLRALLADHGLAIAELDPLLRWVAGEPDAEAGLQDEAAFYAIAEALGARSINVALAAPGELAGDRLAESFAAVCRRAAEHGLLAHLEFLPWTCVGDLPAAMDVVEAAGESNGGVMFDTWHHARSGCDDGVLDTADLRRVQAIQINDAPAEPEENLMAETLQRRLLPGDGDIPLPRLLSRLRAGGCTAPVGVEVFNTELRRLPYAEVAKRAGDATRQVLARAEE